jgi:hypothetical protein
MKDAIAGGRLSAICLGAVLTGIGIVRRKLVFARPGPPSPT